MHKPSGRFGTVTKVIPPDGVYVDFGEVTELLDSEMITSFLSSGRSVEGDRPTRSAFGPCCLVSRCARSLIR